MLSSAKLLHGRSHEAFFMYRVLLVHELVLQFFVTLNFDALP